MLHPEGARVLLRAFREGGVLRYGGLDAGCTVDVRLPLIPCAAMASPEGGPTRPWRAVTMLSISETVAWGALYYSFGVLLRPFASGLGVSEGAVAGAFSVALLTAGAAAFVAGASVDRWGPRPVMTFSALLGAAALASLGVAGTLVEFYVAWAIIGVSHAGVLYEPAFAAVAKWFPAPAQRARALLAVTTVAGFASTIFVPLTATLYEHLGRQRTALLLAMTVAVVVLPLNAALPRRPQGPTASATDGGRERSSPAASPRLAVFALVFSVQAFVSAGVSVHLVSHLRDGGLDLATAATITGLMGAAQVPARLLFHVFQRFLGARVRLPLLLCLQAVALCGVLAGGGVATPAALLLGGANGLMTLERAVVIADAFGSDQVGSVSGRIATFSQAARAAAPVSLGLVKTAASSYAVAFVALAALSVLAALLAWTNERGRQN